MSSREYLLWLFLTLAVVLALFAWAGSPQAAPSSIEFTCDSSSVYTVAECAP